MVTRVCHYTVKTSWIIAVLPAAHLIITLASQSVISKQVAWPWEIYQAAFHHLHCQRIKLYTTHCIKVYHSVNSLYMHYQAMHCVPCIWTCKMHELQCPTCVLHVSQPYTLQQYTMILHSLIYRCLSIYVQLLQHHTLMRNRKMFRTIIVQYFTSYVVNINSDMQSIARCKKSITVHFSWRVWGPLENGAKFAHILGNEVLGLALHVAVDFEILHVATVLQLLLQDNVGQLNNTTTKAWNSWWWKDYNGGRFIGDWIS